MAAQSDVFCQGVEHQVGKRVCVRKLPLVNMEHNQGTKVQRTTDQKRRRSKGTNCADTSALVQNEVKWSEVIMRTKQGEKSCTKMEKAGTSAQCWLKQHLISCICSESTCFVVCKNLANRENWESAQTEKKWLQQWQKQYQQRWRSSSEPNNVMPSNWMTSLSEH